MSVCEQLRIYPSPNSKLTFHCYQFTVVELREELVQSFSDTNIDPVGNGISIRNQTLFFIQNSISSHS